MHIAIRRDVLRDPSHMLFCVTSSVSVGFFDGQLRYLQQQGWTISIAASADQPGQLERFGLAEGVAVHAFPLGRDIQPWADARAFIRAVRLFLRERPAISNVGTPKAGLIMGLAAAVTGVPVRIYTLHGLRLETTSGRKRRVLRIMERLAMATAHKIVCVSPSLRDQVIDLGLANPNKLVVNGAGSVNGVCIPAQPAPLQPESHPVIGFVGRLVRDKGVEDLVTAFRQVRRVIPEAQLLLIGSLDEMEPLSTATVATIAEDDHITLTGHVSDVSSYYSLMNVLTLPSFREGLPSVLLEGAAHGLPTVASTGTGSRDGFVAGLTGWAVSPGHPAELAEALLACLNNPHDAVNRGKSGRAWVSTNFSRERVWEGWNHFYVGILEERVRSRGTRLKRTVDITGALGAIALGALPAALTAVAVRRRLGRPVLFRQTRPGRHGTPFEMLKFRTMTDARDGSGRPLPDSERLNPLGEWLRLTSLDELPGLWNVLIGEMSLVGPRPLLTRYTAFFTKEEMSRLNVRPGLTGWAQIQGRNTLSWDDRLALDVWYVQNRSLTLDLRILAQTGLRVIRRDGVITDPESKMKNLDEERAHR